MRRRFTILLSLGLYLLASRHVEAREPVVGLPCEGCEAVFEEMPDLLRSKARIAPAGEEGQPMIIHGVVHGRDGRPRPGVVVYAYHTNDKGIYPTDDRIRGTAAHRHGRLRGWALTDTSGRYTFETIRPAGYPRTDLPAHVHMHVIERGCGTYYIDDILFTDDPRLTRERIASMTRGRGGDGVATPTRRQGRWVVRRDVFLGRNIPGYPDCGGQ